MKKQLKEIKVGDSVVGLNGPTTVTEIVEEYIPNRLLRIKFKGMRGHVDCTDNHLWYVSLDGVEREVEARFLKPGMAIENKNGPIVKEVYDIPVKPVKCIRVDSEDHNFAIYLQKTTVDKILDKIETPFKALTMNKEDFEKWKLGMIMTENCSLRLACGRLGSVPSMMLFGSTIATTINGSIPGQGMINANGEISTVQYYFTEIDFITKFYKKAGFNEKGFRETKVVQKEEPEKEDIKLDEELDDIEDFFEFDKDIEEIELQGEKVGEFDRSLKQSFE